jgi:phosphotransferase system  glucose/maltose/N-acetylglucosamine-specific IIC component
VWLTVVGGLAWLSTSATYWTRTGNGSTLRGIRLAQWLRTGALRPWWGSIAGTALLVVAFSGCLVVATALMRRPWLADAFAALGSVVTVTMLILVATHTLSLTRWGPAAWLSVAGGVALTLAAARPWNDQEIRTP